MVVVNAALNETVAESVDHCVLKLVMLGSVFSRKHAHV